ncbi:hypothetical protein CHS0354_021233 [Potamilus streckersoni]|uniref:TIR domain-containing protein n=1 Tax=Potamilus streckersoni TaxID=2493646 RepID=A0AAE0S3X4_9BIVA|nr:hypothetical protein CHS0354_021233 [Potamilus streckersoni]
MALSGKTNFEYDVFLVHCEADTNTAKDIDGALTKAGLKCISSFKENVFLLGRDIYESVKNATWKSRVSLVLLTKESKDRPWVTLETILALEKSQHLKQLCIRLLLKGIEKSEEAELKVGILGNLPHLFIDDGSSDWEYSLVESVKAPMPIEEILPAGNLALGQVYSLVIGFYAYVLPALKDGMTKSRYYVPGRTSTKLFILLPHDSKTYPTITDYEQRIKHVGKIDITQKVHVGKPREYKVDLYSIRDDSVEYYFVAEYPNVLNTMYQIQEQDIAEIDLRLQMARFYFTLRKVLTHDVHKNCHETFNIIPYDAAANAEEDKLYNLVMGKIRDELVDIRQEKVSNPITRLILAKEGSEVMDATVTWCCDVPEDSAVALTIQSALNADNWKCETGIGKHTFSYTGRGKWNIFVLSKEGLESDMLKPQYIAAMTESIKEKRLCVIPVLRGMKIEEVPDFIKWVTYLSAEGYGYVERLIQAMKGEEMKTETIIPAGDVATGLAWGFILNYLPIPLLGKGEDNTDLTDRIKKKLKEKALSSACIKRLYITIPKTCQPTPIETNTEKNPNSEPLIESLGRLESVKFTTSGTVNRPYELVMYKMTTKETQLPGGRTEICFLAEQATPSYTLFAMSRQYSNAGLSPKELMEQTRNFSDFCTTCIASQNFKEKVADIEKLCKFVYFDNESKILPECLLEEIKVDMSSDVELVT